MNRRDLIKQVAFLTGGAVMGAELFLAGCKNHDRPVTDFTEMDVNLLDEIGETIIPATTTPGAKAARIGTFMKVMVNDCYTETQQTAFLKGIPAFRQACQKAYGKSFTACSSGQRHELIVNLEKEAKVFNRNCEEENRRKRAAHEKINAALPGKDQTEFEGLPLHYYTMMKQLTLLGFFTSKTGMTETLRHVAVPGRYDGDLPYAKGDKAWAEMY